MAYGDDITVTSTHTSTSAANTNTYNTYNRTCIKFLPGQIYSVHSRLCRIYEKSGPQNKQHHTTQGNASKYSGPYLRPKTHILNVLLVCHQYDDCENSVGSVYVGGYGGLSESGLVSSVNCVQSASL